MHHVQDLLVGCLLSVLLVSPAISQSDAEIALKKARAAYQADQFEQARDLTRQASQTDDKNPDVFLLLGKAHFQLGELDQALTAWRRVVKLAPKHDYATRMVAALEGRLTDSDVRLKLVQKLVQENLLKSALQELNSLRASSVLTGKHKLAVLRIEAEIAISTSNGEAALKAVREIVIRNPEAEGSVAMRLLFARANVAAGGDSAVDGLAALREIAAAAESPEGKAAALELLSHRLSRGENVVQDLVDWITTNKSHPHVHGARRLLLHRVDAFVATTKRMPAPTSDSELSSHDNAALIAATHALAAFIDSSDSLAVVQKLTQHFETHYAKRKAYSAATTGLTKLGALELPADASEMVQAALKRVNGLHAADQYKEIVRDITDGTAGPAALADWIQNNAGHPHEIAARGQLVKAWLAQTKRLAAPRANAELADSDQAALRAAAELIPKLESGDATKLVNEIAKHLQTHYTARLAFAAAQTGLQTVLELKLPPTTRLVALQQLLQTQTAAARSELTIAAAAGRIKPGPLPQSLAAVVATIKTLNAEYPATPAWNQQAALATEVAAIAASLAWPTKVTAAKPPHLWAVELALPVVQSSADEKAVLAAVTVVNKVVTECSAVGRVSSRGLATSVHARLLAAVSDEHALWPAVVLKHVDLLSADAVAVFNENVGTGRRERNEKLTETQQQLLKLLADLVSKRPAIADAALARVDAHLTSWRTAGHDDLIA